MSTIGKRWSTAYNGEVHGYCKDDNSVSQLTFLQGYSNIQMETIINQKFVIHGLMAWPQTTIRKCIL